MKRAMNRQIDIRISFARYRAVIAEHEVGKFAGQYLVSSHKEIQHRLGADDNVLFITANPFILLIANIRLIQQKKR